MEEGGEGEETLYRLTKTLCFLFLPLAEIFSWFGALFISISYSTHPLGNLSNRSMADEGDGTEKENTLRIISSSTLPLFVRQFLTYHELLQVPDH